MIAPSEHDLEEKRAAKIRRFASVVTAGLIVFCNVLLLFGVWVSGVNLDELVKTPDLFDAKEDVCLRLSWERVSGAADPVRLCSEWIKLADPSGKPHQLAKDIAVRRGPDGQYYLDRGRQAGLPFAGIGPVRRCGVVVRPVGETLSRGRYRLQVEPAASRSSSGLH